jgi:hypothetical protein
VSNIKESFYGIARQYRIIKSSVETLSSGCLPSGCLACDEKTHFIAADGCFRMGRRLNAGSSEDSPRLSNFFKDSQECKEIIDRTSTKKNADIKTCGSTFTAGNISRRRNKQAIFDETGTFGIFCARHEVPLSLVDMHYGERFGYLDFLLEDHLKRNPALEKLVLYYDVNCKYKAHFSKANPQPTIEYLIPKFHIKAHQSKCLRLFDPLKCTGNGFTDGETAERNWSFLGKLTITCTKIRNL